MAPTLVFEQNKCVLAATLSIGQLHPCVAELVFNFGDFDATSPQDNTLKLEPNFSNMGDSLRPQHYHSCLLPDRPPNSKYHHLMVCLNKQPAWQVQVQVLLVLVPTLMHPWFLAGSRRGAPFEPHLLSGDLVEFSGQLEQKGICICCGPRAMSSKTKNTCLYMFIVYLLVYIYMFFFFNYFYLYIYNKFIYNVYSLYSY